MRNAGPVGLSGHSDSGRVFNACATWNLTQDMKKIALKHNASK